MAPPPIIAHRGAHNPAPENSLEAFEKAISLGLDMVEFDVRRTKDGVLVVGHDPKISNKPIKSLTSAQLQRLDSNIPTLVEALQVCRGKVKLDVELKESGTHENRVLNLLLANVDLNSFVITSFLQSVIRTVKKKFPQVRVGLLLNAWRNSYVATARDILSLQKNSVQIADFLAPHWSLLLGQPNIQPEFLGKELYVYTVDDEYVIRQLLKRKDVKGIITNEPQTLQRILLQKVSKIAYDSLDNNTNHSRTFCVRNRKQY